MVEIVGSSRVEVVIMQGFLLAEDYGSPYVSTRISESDFSMQKYSSAGGIS
jgi:hypothetical protein